MKRPLSILFAILIFLVSAVSFAGSIMPYVFPMSGKWQPSGQSIMNEEFSFQDVQNLRRDGNAWVGIKGHSKINTTLLSAYPYIFNGFHFKKDAPVAESHVLVVAGDTVTPTNSKVYVNTTAIPTAGDFSATAWYTDTGAGMGQGRFSDAPNGNMVYSNGVVQYIWGGTESRVTAFFTASAAETSTSTILESPGDYSERMLSSKTSDPVSIGRYLFIGTTRPVSGFKFYVGTANTSAGSMSVTFWNGTEWTAVSSMTDNTDNGPTLGQTGTITFTSTESTARPRYIQGLSLYWYQFTLSAEADCTLTQVTALMPAQSVKSIWNGAMTNPASVLEQEDNKWYDRTDEVSDSSDDTYMDLNANDNDDEIYVGSPVPLQGLYFELPATYDNSNAATMSVSYWSGSAWVAVSVLLDSTVSGSASLGKPGTVAWNPIPEGTEQKYTMHNGLPLFYYRVMFSATLDSSCRVSKIRCIESPGGVRTYKLSEHFQSRLFLLNEVGGRVNALRYSASNSPEVWSGKDSGFLYVGNETEITAAKPIFNIFKSGSYDQLIITKANETWRLSGDGPATWTLARINANVGCVAPKTMVSAEVSEGLEEGVKRQVVIFQGNDGVYVTDGGAVIKISDDIRCYFDANDARAIPATMLSKSFGWYDPSINSYKLLIASGSSATYLNTELEYNLNTREWTKVYRADGSGANPLLCGFQTIDTSGNLYTYGGNTKGNLYRLEYGYTFDSTAIAQYLWTKDFIPDKGAPVLQKSTIKNFRVMAKDQAGTMTVTHYGDGSATSSGVNNQATIASINLDTAYYNSQTCNLGPFLYHSFKFSNSASANTGMELNGFGFWFEPFTAWR